MTFLPIVTRELRVAARRRTTFIVRSVVALLGLTIGGFLLLMSGLFGGRSGQGQMVFMVVSRYTLLIALIAGVFLASDCISEERREGTLGFLFLTDLKGYDVVLGKFTAVSLNAFYGMLAIFPVLALSILAGGVTVGEFWRTCLTLVNTLLVSVASALWVSSISKSSYNAVFRAVCLLLGLTLAGVLLFEFSSMVSGFGVTLFFLSALSPLTSFHLASEANYMHRAGEFWVSFAISNVLGWAFLGLAALRLRFFTEKGEGVRRNLLEGRKSRRGELLSINPVLWLLDDSRRMHVLAWGIAIVSGGLLMILSLFQAYKLGAPIMSGYAAGPFYFLLKVLFAIVACRFFSESRRAGSLELLYCTPVTTQQIIGGQWMALRRIFLWPVLTVIICQTVGFCLADFRLFKGNSTEAFLGLLTLYQIIRNVVDFYAIGWFGMWLALIWNKPGAAAGWTILFVIILPTVLMCIPMLLTDVVFIIVGSGKLRQDFRVRVLNRTAR